MANSAARIQGIDVFLWGQLMGKIGIAQRLAAYTFRYSEEFRASGVQPSPLMMPTTNPETFCFTELTSPTYLRLPGLIADSLPDTFGRRVMKHWFQHRGHDLSSDAALVMLAFMNSRAMGALEFRPSRGGTRTAKPIQIPRLCEQARVLLQGGVPISDSLQDLVTVGSSAGGARPKAVVCWNPRTGRFRSGQTEAPPGFEHWIIKFDLDGVGSSLLGRIEYAYHLMARAAGIEMEDCCLHEEGDRAHFMTRRFDRGPGNTRHHIQTLCAMQHLDPYFQQTSSYIQLFRTIVDLGLPYASLMEAFRRMVFNVLARNQDDHTKNHAFRLKQGCSWELAPAYDLTFVLSRGMKQQMWIGQKLTGITRSDCLKEAERFSIAGKSVIREVEDAIHRWPEFAKLAGLPSEATATIHRDLLAANAGF